MAIILTIVKAIAAHRHNPMLKLRIACLALVLCVPLLPIPARALSPQAFPEIVAIYRPPGPPMPPWKQHELMMNPVRAPDAPASPWFDQEKRAFERFIAASAAQVFVAPVQVQLHGLDRSTRALMTEEIAQHLASSHRVANPFSVDRALGEGLRRLDVNDILRAAGSAGAKRILVTYAGHDGKGTLSVAMQPWEFDEALARWIAKPVVQETARIEADEAIAETFRVRILPRLLASVGEEAPSGSRKEPPGKALHAFPASLHDAFEAAQSGPLGESAYCQLLGMLAPAAPARARERLFEQSLLALDRMGDAGRDVKLLRARALYYLHSRPAALAALGEPSTPGEKAFRAFLDGNLPELAAATPHIEHGLFRAFSELELRDLQLAYKVPVTNELPAYFADAAPDWHALIARRLIENDPWKVQKNVALKALLDRVMPIAGFDLDTAARGASVLGGNADAEDLGLLVFDHIRRMRHSEAFLAKCPLGRVQCPPADFLDLVEAAAISNAVKAVDRAARVQAAYDSADRLAATFAAKLDGQPDFELAESEAPLGRTINRANPPAATESAAYLRHAIAALYWEQGQSRTSFRAIINGARTTPWLPLVEEYLRDLPARAYWIDQTGVDVRDPAAYIARARTRLRETVWDIQPARELKESLPKDQLAQLGREIEGRFHGNPDRGTLAGLSAKAAGSDAGSKPGNETRIAAFLAAEKERPDLWSNYSDHGDYLVYETGDYAAAAQAYLAFPGFSKPDAYDPVALGNHAFEAGSMLYFRGDFEDARKLFAIAARFETGSRAYFESVTRLQLLDDHYEAAAAGSLQTASRYGNAYAVRDYLSWMFVFGLSGDAWAGFDQVAGRLADPQAWSAAQVGKRKEARSDAELRQWLQSEPIRNAGTTGRFALLEAVLLNTVDRKPWPDLPEFLAKLEGKPRAKFDTPSFQGGTVLVPSSSGGYTFVDRSKLRTANPPFKEGDPVPSDLVYFARAYVPLREGRYAEAADRFQDMTQLYPVESSSGGLETSYALPYYAWAAARSGDKHGLESFLDKRGPKFSENFDHHLAKAIFTGLRGQREESLAHLERAFDYRPFTGSRPIFTEYQWAETCEWLFDATHDVRYRDLALRMARINEKVQPFFAWSYAMEAKLSPPGPARTRALAIALHLDRGSERIAGFSSAEKAAAKAWFAANNPFKLQPPEEPSTGKSRS